ncbi:hypothetical protein BY996DRAFT_7378550 [Phakopsora pachyrhizi]|nr:hypothetical protein BY996DRAFT_7378550 [Phakopsora pachyrhizi]
MTNNNQSSSTSIYVDHLINQIISNLELLHQNSNISSQALDLIKKNLPDRSSLSDVQSKQSSTQLKNQQLSPSRKDDSNTQTLISSNQQQPSQPHPINQSGILLQPKRAQALWSYKGNAPDDLSFEKGDIIIVLAEENEDWWRGQILNSQAPPGLFPSNHVQIISQPIPSNANRAQAPLPSPQPNHQHPSASIGQQYQQPAGYHNPSPQPQQVYQHNQSPAWQAPPYSQSNYQVDSKQGAPVQHHQPPPPLPYSHSAPPAQITVEKPKKKPLQGRFGQALVGGAGFGAGSAVASHVGK